MNAFKLNRSEALDAAMVFVLTLVGLSTLRSSYGGFVFMVVGAVAAVVGLIVAHLGTKWRWPIPVVAAVALVVYCIVGGAVSLPERAIAGVVPSPASTMAAFREAVVGWKELITTSPPVGRTGDLMVLQMQFVFEEKTDGYVDQSA